eukprot:TRINITY_DN24877_c0_g1_i1.p1 TRINITY_DN24877_c0_g1~~TRINITY_DN24877_c0_g1_i1.p1  ORF type:complete len:290 (+),score=33.33 TRINITY_DN24877_c0_g1_i1:149-1018(+)
MRAVTVPLFLPFLVIDVALSVLVSFSEEQLKSRPAGANDEINTNGNVGPSVAFHVLGYANMSRPVWARERDQVHMFAPNQSCHGCPRTVVKPKFSNSRFKSEWWCAQRNYLPSLVDLVTKHPKELEHVVLNADDDLYLGHGFRNHNNSVPAFVMTGGGALLRGTTLRRLVQGGHLQRCIDRVKTDWCWHHLDWSLSECLLDIGVTPRGSPAFQQFLGLCRTCCRDNRRVSCHPVKDMGRQRLMVGEHQSVASMVALGARDRSWAHPCKVYDFRDYRISSCGRKSAKFAI